MREERQVMEKERIVVLSVYVHIKDVDKETLKEK